MEHSSEFDVNTVLALMARVYRTMWDSTPQDVAWLASDVAKLQAWFDAKSDPIKFVTNFGSVDLSMAKGAWVFKAGVQFLQIYNPTLQRGLITEKAMLEGFGIGLASAFFARVTSREDVRRDLWQAAEDSWRTYLRQGVRTNPSPYDLIQKAVTCLEAVWPYCVPQDMKDMVEGFAPPPVMSPEPEALVGTLYDVVDLTGDSGGVWDGEQSAEGGEYGQAGDSELLVPVQEQEAGALEQSRFKAALQRIRYIQFPIPQWLAYPMVKLAELNTSDRALLGFTVAGVVIGLLLFATPLGFSIGFFSFFLQPAIGAAMGYGAGNIGVSLYRCFQGSHGEYAPLALPEPRYSASALSLKVGEGVDFLFAWHAQRQQQPAIEYDGVDQLNRHPPA